MLAQDEMWRVRNAIAGNINTPSDVLAMLAKDVDVDVRCMVTDNKNTSVETLVMLSKDNNEWVSEAAIKALSKNKERSKNSIER